MSKKKIMLLSDDLRMSSGVGTVSKNFVLGTLDKYDWVQVGGAIKHPEEGKVQALRPHFHFQRVPRQGSLRQMQVIYFCENRFLQFL